MGIKGLHKGLAFCTKKGNLRDYRGRSIAVDSSSWLHRSVYSVSAKYVESMERKHLDSDCVRVSSQYIISRCYEILNSFHIAEIFLVMDGKRCPLKANESADREERRQQNLREARAFKQGGLRHKAEEKYKMCIKIRDELTLAVMDVVANRFRNDKRVKVIWSPYEADAQLAKLCQDQIAHAVVTEDSDVLVYAAAVRVPFPVLFKLDRRNGCCDVISMDWLLSAPTSPANGKPKTALEGLLLNFASREARRSGFGVRLFVQGCVLAGCDYAPNTLPGVGL
jgi:exonuclease-1